MPGRPAAGTSSPVHRLRTTDPTDRIVKGGRVGRTIIPGRGGQTGRENRRGCRPSPIPIYFLLFRGNVVWRSERLTGPGPRGESMRFHLIDRIDAVEPGKSLRAAKFLALG